GPAARVDGSGARGAGDRPGAPGAQRDAATAGGDRGGRLGPGSVRRGGRADAGHLCSTGGDDVTGEQQGGGGSGEEQPLGAAGQPQIAFARATQGAEEGEGAAAGGAAASGEQPAAGTQEPAASDRASKDHEQAEADRAKARSKIWTPPGT